MSRKIVTVRHGERMDFTFTDDWLNRCFDSEGSYSRQNLNQPETVPARAGSPKTFYNDCPLTEVGCLQAKLIGQGLASEKILGEEFEVYVSPALRCLETATGIMKGMGKLDVKLKVEPCLFEWTQWYTGQMPQWMTNDEFKEAGFNIDDTYKPMISLEDLKEGEASEAYYERSYQLMLHLLQQTGSKNLLCVAHGSSLETNSRQLMGYPIRTEQEMVSAVRGVSYCGVAVMEQDEMDQKWRLAEVPKLHIRHAPDHDFDAYKVLYGG